VHELEPKLIKLFVSGTVGNCIKNTLVYYRHALPFNFLTRVSAKKCLQTQPELASRPLY